MTVVDRRYSVSEGTAVKAACRVATTANITLSGEQTIDGVAVTSGDRVLVKDQTDATENGIYQVSTGNWTRTPDFDGAYDAVTGTRVFVLSGTIAAVTEWYLETTGTITIGTTELAFQFRDVGGMAGPVASVDNEIALFSGTSGALLKRASGTGVLTATSGVAAFQSSLPVSLGGHGATTKLGAQQALDLEPGIDVQVHNDELDDLAGLVTAQGNILYRGATSWAVLAPGTSGQLLQTQGAGANPIWADTVTIIKGLWLADGTLSASSSTPRTLCLFENITGASGDVLVFPDLRNYAVDLTGLSDNSILYSHGGTIRPNTSNGLLNTWQIQFHVDGSTVGTMATINSPNSSTSYDVTYGDLGNGNIHTYTLTDSSEHDYSIVLVRTAGSSMTLAASIAGPVMLLSPQGTFTE